MAKDIILQTIIYVNGGNYYGEVDASTKLDEFKEFGKDVKQMYMYKGYRRFVKGGSQSVVVFDNKRWDSAEIARRKANGFLGIREYPLRK